MSPAISRLGAVVACAALATSTLAAQDVNPSTAQQKPPTQHPAPPSPDWTHLRTWELPVTEVLADRLPLLYEDERVGPYGQPRWTTKRLFPTTRTYVAPPGKLEFEHWTRVKVPEKGSATIENQYEMEVGLPGRFQLDLYLVTEKTGTEGELDITEQKFEVRHALADWGEIWGNPTLYLEWVERNADVDAYEAKLLLADELAPGWHWGSNLVFERDVGGDLANEYALTFGISHPVIDSKLALGGELKIEYSDVHGDRGDYEQAYEIGPSMRWQPFPAFHLDFAPLVGFGPDARDFDLYLVMGWEF